MARRQTTPMPRPVHLPTEVSEAWLLDCAPAGGCHICSANWKQLEDAKAAGNINQAFKHADEIRNHDAGAHR